MIGKVNVSNSAGGGNICVVTFIIEPEEADLVVKNKEGNIMKPHSDNLKVYDLPAGIYSYEATLDGYPTITVDRIDVVEDIEIEVFLYKIVTFSNGTDKEIIAMLKAHYDGRINISDYWAVGDTRTMHLNAMSSGTGANESHVAQDMVMTIIGIEHDDLKEQIGERTKAAITVQCRETLGKNGTEEKGYYWGNTQKNTVNSNYSQNPRRNWFNNKFINALPDIINENVKTVIKKNLTNHTSSPEFITTEDKAFFLSYPEVFGNVSYSYYSGNIAKEGEQYKYYKTTSRRIKYINNNGNKGSTATQWWLRSPGNSGIAWTTPSYYWLTIGESGTCKEEVNGHESRRFFLWNFTSILYINFMKGEIKNG